MRYAGGAGVIAESRGTVVAARLSTRDLRQQAWRVTPRKRGHVRTIMMLFIYLASFRRRSGASAPKQSEELCGSDTRLSTTLNVSGKLRRARMQVVLSAVAATCRYEVGRCIRRVGRVVRQLLAHQRSGM